MLEPTNLEVIKIDPVPTSTVANRWRGQGFLVRERACGSPKEATSSLPMRPMNFNDRWLLVTGASSGLGQAMARQLAERHGANLIVVARRAERLEALRRELKESTAVEVYCLVADLSKAEDVERVYREATDGRHVYGVVLNAGVTHFGPHLELEWPAFLQMLATNVTSVVRLTTLFSEYMKEKDSDGGILMIASMAGFVPVAYQSAYSGTKGFLLNFGSALWHELKDENHSLTVFAPGGIATEMTEKAGMTGAMGKWDFMVMDADTCATHALRAFQRRDFIYVPGVFNRVGMHLLRILPRRFYFGQVAATYRNALKRRT